MNTPLQEKGKWDERPNAAASLWSNNGLVFGDFFERSADPIWIFDPKDRVFVDCNAAAVSLMRAHDKAELLGRTPDELSPPKQPDGRKSSESVEATIDEVRRSGSLRFEWVARRFDGENLPLQVLITPILFNGYEMHVIVSRDISIRKQAEAAARESEQLLASIADNLSEALYRTGPHHELIFANPAYLRLSGYESQAEMQSTPREKLYARPADRERLLGLLERDGAFRNEEIEYIRRDGTHWWGLTNSVAIRDPKTGVVLYHVGSVADITERKQAADEIRTLNATLERRIAERTAELTASEARLRTLVEHAPEAIVVFDGDTAKFLSSNAPACELYGCDAEELTRLGPADVSPEFQPNGRLSRELAREKMDEALAGGTPVFEWLHQHKSGRLVETEVRLVRLPAEGPRLLRASITDQTERYRREKMQHATFEISEAVHTTEDLASLYARIHTIVKGLMPAENFYIALADPGGQTFSFPYLVDAHDLSTTPLPLDKGWTGYVMRSGKPLLAGSYNAVSADGKVVLAENGERVEAVDCGARLASIWLGAPLAFRGSNIGVLVVQDYENPRAYGDEEKKILTFVGAQIAQAIERKRAEQALRESEEKFRALFEASSQGVILHDENQYLAVNPAAVRILGYRSQDELIGLSPGETSPPIQANGESSQTLAGKHIQECMTNGKARFEWLARRASGESIPLEVILTRIEWRGRQIIQAAISDISERKRAEAELLRTLAREKELGQLKNSFVSMVSHEFRTPLGIIQSSTEILADYLDKLDPADRREQLDSIVKNTRRMANLMEEVLVLGRLDAGKMDFHPGPVDLRAFCQRTVDEISAATERRCAVMLNCECESNELQADESLMRHIFTNLLSNAVKFSDPGQPVRFDVRRDAKEVTFTIADQGAGIPEADLPHLFNAFHRGGNVGHVAGTGLGLTIVRRCAELHRGQIKIESVVGKGTTVIVRLPVISD